MNDPAPADLQANDPQTTLTPSRTGGTASAAPPFPGTSSEEIDALGNKISNPKTGNLKLPSLKRSALATNIIWAAITLFVILGLYIFRNELSRFEDHLGSKFSSFIQPFKVTRASVFKNYLVLLLLWVFQTALMQEIPLIDVPNYMFLFLVVVTWLFWFVLSN